MNIKEFALQMARLKSVPKWKNEYHDELEKLIFAQVEDLEPNDVSKFISAKIGESRFAPNVADFRDLRIALENNKHESKKLEERPWNNGLKDVLRQMGVNSLSEAIKKRGPA